MKRLELTRRQWLASAAATGALAGSSHIKGAEPRPKVAAVFTELRLRSHAFHILTSLMGPYLFRGKWIDPGVDVVSFYADQFPERRHGPRRVASGSRCRCFKTIDEALCLGGKSLAVDAVLLIGEHGDYPTNELGQTMYPRKEFFDQIVAVDRAQRAAGAGLQRQAPLVSLGLGQGRCTTRPSGSKIPLMAGSSVPLAERRPPLEFPAGAVVEEAVSIHGGGIESYDFHALEVMQSLIEARRGGETGISQVQLLDGDACRKAHAARPLVAASWSTPR